MEIRFTKNAFDSEYLIVLEMFIICNLCVESN